MESEREAVDLALKRCDYNCNLFFTVNGKECGTVMYGNRIPYIAVSIGYSSSRNAAHNQCRNNAEKCFFLNTICAESKDNYDEFFAPQ